MRQRGEVPWFWRKISLSSTEIQHGASHTLVAGALPWQRCVILVCRSGYENAAEKQSLYTRHRALGDGMAALVRNMVKAPRRRRPAVICRAPGSGEIRSASVPRRHHYSRPAVPARGRFIEKEKMSLRTDICAMRLNERRWMAFRPAVQ